MSGHYPSSSDENADLEFNEIRGLQGVKVMETQIGDRNIRVAVAHGLGNVEKVLSEVRETIRNEQESPYHFIEIMACPGGCLGGGGQPVPTNAEVRGKRAKAIYDEDESLPIRKSHENPEIAHIYQEFLTEGPLGHKSHKLLHTHYTKRSKKNS